MPEIRIISRPEDSSPRPAMRSLRDALAHLMDRGELAPGSQLRLFTSPSSDQSAWYSSLRFRSTKGGDALFVLPTSRACRVTDTYGSERQVTLDRLDGADVDCDGNVQLRDGTYVHAVAFDVVPLHSKLPELEETIVYLTIRYLQAETTCIRNEYGFMGIDYSTLPTLRVPNVKALTLFINATIGEVPRSEGKPAFSNVSLATVQRTLDLVGIQKVRGRPKRLPR